MGWMDSVEAVMHHGAAEVKSPASPSVVVATLNRCVTVAQLCKIEISANKTLCSYVGIVFRMSNK